MSIFRTTTNNWFFISIKDNGNENGEMENENGENDRFFIRMEMLQSIEQRITGVKCFLGKL